MAISEREFPRWILYLVGIFPVIDFFNGVFLDAKFSLPIGSMYRFALLFALLYVFLKDASLGSSSFGTLFIFSVCGIVLLLSIQTIFFNNSLSVFLNDLSTIIKYLLWLLIASVFSKLKEATFTRLMIVIDLFFALGMLIPYVLGLGNFTYQSSKAGYKSFFFATNDLTYAFTILCTLLIFLIISSFHRSDWRNFFKIIGLYASNIVCLILIGTKTGIVFSSASLILTVLFLLFFKRNVPYQVKFLLIQLLLLSTVFMYFWGKDIFFNQIQGTIDRMTYFYRLYEGNWVKLLSSSRSIYFADAITNFKAYPGNQWVFLIGFGFANRWTFFGRQGGYIEMDFLDTFFSLGVIGSFIFLVPLIYLIYRVVAMRLYNKYFFLLLMTLGFAATSGHVFYSALSATLFGLIASRLLLSTRNEE